MQCLLPLPLPELSPTNALRNRLSIPFCFPTKQKHWLWPPGGPYTLNGQLLCAQSHPTLCDLLECSPPGSSVHGIFQARILVWGAISYFRGSSRPGDRTRVWIGRQVLYHRCHLFILLLGLSRQEHWRGLPFPSPVDHVLSELSTVTRPSWVALHGMAHSFIELDKAVVHVISLISFLWWWFSFCLPSEG